MVKTPNYVQIQGFLKGENVSRSAESIESVALQT
jgi:hypothetical protein